MSDEPDRLGWWCQDCRETGALHCAEVEYCIESGQMKQLPYDDRKSRYEALRPKEPTP